MNGSISNVFGSGSNYTVAAVMTFNAAHGTLGLNLVDNDSIVDRAGNPLGARAPATAT